MSNLRTDLIKNPYVQLLIKSSKVTLPLYIYFEVLLKEQADYYEEVLTDYWAKCSRLQELKKKMQWQNNRVQLDLFRKAFPITEKWKYLKSEWKPSDRILSAHLIFQRIAFQRCLKLHRKKYPNVPIPLI